MKLGIDLGGTNIAAAVVDTEFRCVKKSSIPTRRQRPAADIIRDMALLARQVVEQAGLDEGDIESVGIGCPGVLDKVTGTVLYSNNIRWDRVDLRGEFQKHLQKPVYMDNDANCAALGEYIAGAARGCSSALAITLGTGVGGGLILDGKIYSGFNAAANVFGHSIIMSGGEKCTCGRRGCWEMYASVTALIRMGRQSAQRYPDSQLARLEREGTPLDGKNIFVCAKEGDAAAQELVARYLFFVGEGITDFVNLLQPEVIVVGGGLSGEGDSILDPIRQQVQDNVFCKIVPQPRLRLASLGNDAGIIGAAWLREYQQMDAQPQRKTGQVMHPA